MNRHFDGKDGDVDPEVFRIAACWNPEVPSKQADWPVSASLTRLNEACLMANKSDVCIPSLQPSSEATSLVDEDGSKIMRVLPSGKIAVKSNGFSDEM